MQRCYPFRTAGDYADEGISPEGRWRPFLEQRKTQAWPIDGQWGIRRGTGRELQEDGDAGPRHGGGAVLDGEDRAH